MTTINMTLAIIDALLALTAIGLAASRFGFSGIANAHTGFAMPPQYTPPQLSAAANGAQAWNAFQSR